MLLDLLQPRRTGLASNLGGLKAARYIDASEVLDILSPFTHPHLCNGWTLGADCIQYREGAEGWKKIDLEVFAASYGLSSAYGTSGLLYSLNFSTSLARHRSEVSEAIELAGVSRMLIALTDGNGTHVLLGTPEYPLVLTPSAQVQPINAYALSWQANCPHLPFFLTSLPV